MKKVNELSHFGILGMRWGIRKDERYNRRVRLEPGSKIQRIGSKKETLHGMKYVSFTRSDNKFYKDMFLDDTKTVLNYKAKEVIITPTQKQAADQIIESMRKIPIKELVNMIKPTTVFKMEKDIQRQLQKTFAGDEKSKEKTSMHISIQMYRDELASFRKKYFSDLSKQGYNAIIDRSDTGLTKFPLIIFNGKKSLMFDKK